LIWIEDTVRFQRLAFLSMWVMLLSIMAGVSRATITYDTLYQFA